MDSPYTVTRSLVKVYHSIIEELFPAECVVCGQEGIWLCLTCESQSLKIQTPTCPFCDRLSPLGKTCSRCQRHYALSGNRSLWYYRGPIQPLVHGLKYRSFHDICRFAMPKLATLSQELPRAKHQPLIITSVPSSRSRFASRGYNQSELLARALAQTLDLPYKRLLVRTTDTPPQVQLTRAQRFANMQNQFVLASQTLVKNCVVVIVDDVITTGATLTSCASQLKAAGAKQVWSLTLAKD